MAENEVYFRQHNEQVKKGFDTVKEIAKQDSQVSYLDEDDAPLHFHCECSDENCRQRLLIKPSEYTKIHERRDHFVVVPGHEVPSVERIIRKGKEFYVIEKLVAPPARASGLKPSGVDNS